MRLPFAESKATVVGLGATGLSLVRFLVKRDVRVCVVDSLASPTALTQLKAEFPEVEYQQVDLARDRITDADWVALSPGVPRATYCVTNAINRGLQVVGDVELFAQTVDRNASVVAVTGSNGKTTTTALAGALIKAKISSTQVAGNIGLPVLDALDANPDCASWVLELSSFQLESTYSLHLKNAAVLNVTENHLDRYPSFFDYAASKARVFEHTEAQVLNRNDLWSMAMQRKDCRYSSFGSDAPQTKTDAGLVRDTEALYLIAGGETVITSREMHLRGEHNLQNALAALLLAWGQNSDVSSQREVLQNFAGMPHRCEWLGEVAGVDVINDSKATTTIASIAAMTGLNKPTWLIAGGDAKAQRFEEFAQVAAKYCRKVFLIGRDAPLIASALDSIGVAFEFYARLEDATMAALESASPGEQILLSPACASWDMFKNYAQRAQVFESAVLTWCQSKGRECRWRQP